MVDEHDPYATTYNEATDFSWDGHQYTDPGTVDVEKCIYDKNDKEYNHKVLSEAQRFTNPDISLSECLEIAKSLYDMVDLDNDHIIT